MGLFPRVLSHMWCTGSAPCVFQVFRRPARPRVTDDAPPHPWPGDDAKHRMRSQSESDAVGVQRIGAMARIVTAPVL
ncbi:hypothetical protein Salmuc_01514 [Salipiger mucosus DSM 16094]|uniref:Uncharacterized protein n=1 Tax=Salipiger mucosus DSM 16094 TaxID=1123237 RepID=S9R4D9_9RHOB|nr:hypothetical protein Salmuc_01514 [Salipiger mucosus DSM 16094]